MSVKIDGGELGLRHGMGWHDKCRPWSIVQNARRRKLGRLTAPRANLGRARRTCRAAVDDGAARGGTLSADAKPSHCYKSKPNEKRLAIHEPLLGLHI